MIIFDTESDGLVDEATKFWIFGWTEDGENIHSTTDHMEFYEVLMSHDSAGCHNAITHDFQLMRKLHNFNYTGLKIDTLALSWYLFPKNSKHGLEEWGEYFDFPKVEVEDKEWKDLDPELAKERVERDVLINWKLWEVQKNLLEELYNCS